jgi:thiamine-monophosphate kinase
MAKTHKIDRRFDPDEMPFWLFDNFHTGYLKNKVIAGINEDDCAILKIGKEELVVTVDYLNANPITLEMKLGSFWDLGRLLVASNLSDLCGTGALPIAFLASIMLEKAKSTEKDFKQLMSGVKFELDKYHIPLVGGDTKLGNANSLCGIAIGVKEKGTKLFLKNAAKVGHSIWVSGNLGGVSAAIDGLKLNKMGTKWNSWAKKKIISPILPYKKSRYLAKRKIVFGGTDISDGLGADLWSLCLASNIGAIVYADRIPYDKEVGVMAKQRKIDPWAYSLTIGGDFQFLFTSKSSNDSKLKQMGFSKIGETIKEKKAIMVIDEKKYNMPILGHRDKNKKTFNGEIEYLLREIKNLKHDN